MSTHWMAQLAEFRSNRDDADVTLNCQLEVIKAHSLILGIRYVCSAMVIIHPKPLQLLLSSSQV